MKAFLDLDDGSAVAWMCCLAVEKEGEACCCCCSLDPPLFENTFRVNHAVLVRSLPPHSRNWALKVGDICQKRGKAGEKSGTDASADAESRPYLSTRGKKGTG